jgi:anti-sigma-K factor RskA
VTWDHERVEELLAAHAVDGLDPEEAALAERALLEHVPGCERCRRALDGYRLVAGDLALAAPAASAPDTLLPRLRRSVIPPRRRTWVAWVVGGAAGVILLGLSGGSLLFAGSLSGRLDTAQRQQGWLVDALSTWTHPSAEVEPLVGPGDQRVSILYVPGERHVYVMAAHLPDPEFAYHVWFLGGGTSWHAGVLETHHGWGMMPVDTDPDQWEVVMLTDEPAGRPEPQASPLVSATVSER